MKRLLPSLLAAAFLLSSPLTAQAETIAVVNIQQIMRDSTAAQSVREQLESKEKSFRSEISKKEEQLQKEDQELAKQRSVLAKEAFEDKVKAFRNKATGVQKEAQSKRAIFDKAVERSLGEIQKAVGEIIAGMAQEKGFIIAIPTSQILYADGKLDISEEVLKRLNQKLPKIDVKFSDTDGEGKAEKNDKKKK